MNWSQTVLESSSLLVVAGLALTFVSAIERSGEARFGGRTARGSWGFRRSVADFLKLLAKEEFVPNHAARRLYRLAPVLAFGFAFMSLAFLPLVPGVNDEFGSTKSLVLESDYGLFWMALLLGGGCAAVALGGWASNNKLTLLGGLRALSRLFSVQLVFLLAMASLAMSAGTARLDLVATSQNEPFLLLLPQWNLFAQPLGAITCFFSGLALCGAPPFGLMEGRGNEDLVDPLAEYGALKFAMFVVADRIRLFSFAVLFAASYLGGSAWPWSHFTSGPEGFQSFWPAMIGGLVLFVKTLAVLWAANWLGWAWLRFRPRDLASFAWRWLLPAAVLNLLWVAALLAGGGLG